MKILKKGAEKSDDSLETVTGGYLATRSIIGHPFEIRVLYQFSEEESKIIKEKTGKNLISSADYYFMENLNHIFGFDCRNDDEMANKLREKFGITERSWWFNWFEK